jgi:antirestriction protein
MQVAQFNHGQAGNTKMPMKNTSSAPAVSPRIYVRCLACYNAGILHGAWIDADQDADAIQEEVQAMLAASPVPDAEEWAIHDYEGFGDVRISEYESFEKVSELASFIEKHGRIGLAVLGHYSGDLEDAERAMGDCLGTYASLADYAESTMDGVEIPASVAPYVDYEGMGRDMEMNGDIFTIELGFDEVLIFVSH